MCASVNASVATPTSTARRGAARTGALRIFACDFLASEELRQEIHAGLQVENWNSANEVVFYGKDGKLTGPDRETVEVSMLALHLLQSGLVYINTLLLQRVLADPVWVKRLTAEIGEP